MIPRCSVTGPCGHTTDFDLSCVGRDSYACCSCGTEWHVTQAPPIRHPSGWLQPGKRTVVSGPPKPTRPHAPERRSA
jgi:hypothetical protein